MPHHIVTFLFVAVVVRLVLDSLFPGTNGLDQIDRKSYFQINQKTARK